MLLPLTLTGMMSQRSLTSVDIIKKRIEKQLKIAKATANLLISERFAFIIMIKIFK